MTNLLDEQYFAWLYKQVIPSGESLPEAPNGETYWYLLKQLYCKEFVWFVPNDDNRAEDGKDLRYEFFHEEGIEGDSIWVSLGCSVLEMLIGLSRRLAFEDGGDSIDWFWQLIENLGLLSFTDYKYTISIMEEFLEEIDVVLERLIWRNYGYDGTEGGLFPLSHPSEDQRQVEIWYQMNAYLIENN